MGHYELAISWLDSLGLPYSKTRFGGYRKAIYDFERRLTTDTEEEFQRTFYQFLNAHSEIVEIIRIYNDLHKFNFSDYIDQLRKVTGGQGFRNGSAKDQSRDFAFELTMAARFVRGGFAITLNNQADVIAKREDTPKIYVECKRIKSGSKISKNISKANSQLKKRLSLDLSNKSRGFVAINVNDVVNPKNTMLIVPSAAILQEYNSENLDKFALDNEDNFKAGKFSKCLGVFCEQTDQAYLHETERPTIANCRGVKFYMYTYSASNDELIVNLAASLSNQHIRGQ